MKKLFVWILIASLLSPGSAHSVSLANFKATEATHSEKENLEQIVKNELGMKYRLADWNDIIRFYNDGGNVQAFENTFGTQGLLTWNGQRFWTGGENRHFFYQISHRPGETPYDSFLSHANIGNHQWDLGSWYGLNQKILGYTDRPTDIVSTISNLLLSQAPVFNGPGPSSDGGLLTSTQKVVPNILSSNDSGVAVIENNELDASVKITLKDSAGNPVKGLTIQSMSLDGNIFIVATDPQLRYAPIIYKGNPVVDAYQGTNPNITIENERIIGLTIGLLITVTAFAYLEIDYALKAHSMDVFHHSNIAGTAENAGYFRCTVNSLIEYMKAYYIGKIILFSIPCKMATGLISDVALSIGYKVTELMTATALKKTFEALAIYKYNKPLSELYGTFDENTIVWVMIKNLNSFIEDYPFSTAEITILGPDDELEENDSIESPTTLKTTTNNGLRIYDSDPDFYQFYLNQGDKWTADAYFLPIRGKINLDFYSPTGQLLKSSLGTVSPNRISTESAPTYGNYVLKVSKSESTWDSNVYNLIASSLGGTISTSNNYRIVLTWGNSPSDLDSHLWTPVIDGTTHHLYFSYKGTCEASPYACLDVDDTSSYGPETMTISRPFQGKYAYGVYNYSGGNISGTNANVKIYNNSGLLRELTVPQTGDGRWWDVFEIDGETGSLTINNTVRTTSPRTLDKLPPK